MKTLAQVKELYKSETLDGRDLQRLAQFIPEDEFADFGLTISESHKGKHVALPLTRDNVLKQLEEDVDFGFYKAMNKRGISAGLMYDVVSMWNWILEEGLEYFDDYAQYGLPLFKATAIKYGFKNPIGEHAGNEYRYSSNSDY